MAADLACEAQLGEDEWLQPQLGVGIRRGGGEHSSTMMVMENGN